ncbi:hypothetical protein D3C75_434800 [compost metagenome]
MRLVGFLLARRPELARCLGHDALVARLVGEALGPVATIDVQGLKLASYEALPGAEAGATPAVGNQWGDIRAVADDQVFGMECLPGVD